MVAYANAGKQYEQYRQQGVMTASPGELTLMLYDGCIKDLKLARMYIQEKDYGKANEYSQKAQAIMGELMGSLDMHYPISGHMIRLYDYILSQIVASNVKKDVGILDEALSMVTEFRDVWQQAVRLNRQRVMGAGNQI